MKEIVQHVLENIYAIDQQCFQIIGYELGLQENKTETLTEGSKKESNDKSSETKDKLKNKKSKLLAKMKNKGKKFLTENHDANSHQAPTQANNEEELIQCAFCQE